MKEQDPKGGKALTKFLRSFIAYVSIAIFEQTLNLQVRVHSSLLLSISDISQ